MLGFGAVGEYALGQVKNQISASSILIGVSGTGAVGTLVPMTGLVPAVYGVGSAGLIQGSTLGANPRRLLANALRRLRTLSPQDSQPM